ncbi:acetoacetate decarboxylase family protein [Solirubrobacter phytolaccae]|uniref:Acetoacetate decarboxylase family protein n=1 Tax=Solirubrobacter phytolaccae TaxID=1404360 RepID=A0A9X3NG48_9ACTN|nr:acetoacetate decarboxylase family protein [Solirubrobacter phytolaccae]MDA0184432.1 acetoacetate decarboxylase family protein [Solirubrobacter phytolaccae]
MPHPPAPWHLNGELVVVPARTPGRQLGGVMLANYTSGTLVYRELIVFSHATTKGMVVSHIYVDDEQSMSGGREIWGLPKELATFTYERDSFTARQGDVTLLHARLRRRPGFLPLVIPTPITSDAGVTIGSAKIKAAPALVELQVPHNSPFAYLGLAGRHVALAGDDLRLHMPPPS